MTELQKSLPPSRRRGKANLVFTNFIRNRKSVALSSIGLTVGVSALVFFIGLSEGIKNVVLGRVFLIDQVEVIPPKLTLGAQALGALFGGGGQPQGFTDEALQSLGQLKGVSGAFPKMKFTFPAFGYGGKAILGRDVRGELIADGVDPALVKSELEGTIPFVDREAPLACQSAEECDVGMTCSSGQCAPMVCTPSQTEARGQDPQPCPTGSYCASDLNQCLRPIPIILNPNLLELYNGGLAIALGNGGSLPKISPALVKNFTFNVELNRSAIMRSRGRALSRQLTIVDFNDKAISVGATLPIEYVKRFNERFTSPDAGAHYHSVILKVEDQRRFPEIIEEVKQRGYELADQTANAVQAAKILLSIEAVFTLIALGIVALASLNISQMFFMLITQRRREIGLLRALGASPLDIQKIIIGEASLIGLVGGIFGVLLGVGASLGVDALATQLPRFPYKPESFFLFPTWVYPMGVLVALIFCAFGAFFPARTAAKQDPAEALTR